MHVIKLDKNKIFTYSFFYFSLIYSYIYIKNYLI